jgi:D-serine deaminase-like pyridoxal phosphate-dependent protein
MPRAVALPPQLDTPCLVVDLEIVERNADRMASAMRARGVALRPHIKTHKSVAIARMQLAAGAVGVTVGTLGEAEVMADGGIEDIFIAYPLWVEGPKADRLRALIARPDIRLSVGVDSVAAARRLSAVVGKGTSALTVLLEVDPGNRRTGVRPVQAGEVARAIQEVGVELVGAFSHAGHSYAGPGAAAAAAEDEVEALRTAADSLRAAGISPVGVRPVVLSAGSSPTALEAARAPVTELRPGTYIVGDRQQVALGASPPDGVALSVAATVVSDAVEGQVVIDAGAKSLTKDRPGYLPGYGCLPNYPEGVIERVSDYHGVVVFPERAARPQVGEVVAVVPNHACPVMDLYDSFVATRGDEVVGRWSVDARGRSG